MKREKIMKEIWSYFKIVVIAFAVAFTINHTLITNANVPTGSMENTVMTGSRIIVNRLAYIEAVPQRGDIVSFRLPDDETQIYLKRIIGLPGETIVGTNGKVLINDTILEEPYIKDEIDKEFGPYVIPEGMYFMMGDNRNNSWDSRFWNEKFVTRDAIIGKAEFEYFPQMKSLRRESE